RGVELYMEYNILSNADWRISINGNGAYNKNEILELAGANEDGVIPGGFTPLGEGHSVREFSAVRYAGVNPANGHGLFYDIDGNLTENLNEADRVYTDKTSIPRIKGGFGA